MPTDLQLKFCTPYKCPNGHIRYDYWELPNDRPDFTINMRSELSEPYCSCEGVKYNSKICGPHELYLGNDVDGREIYTGTILLGPTHSNVWGPATKRNKTKIIQWKIQFDYGINSPSFHVVPLNREEMLRTCARLSECQINSDIYRTINVPVK